MDTKKPEDPKSHQHCLLLKPPALNPFALLTSCASRSLSKLHSPDGVLLKNPVFVEDSDRGMETLGEKIGRESEESSESTEAECKGSNWSSETSSTEEKSQETMAAALGWPMRKSSVSGEFAVDGERTQVGGEGKLEKPKPSVSEIEMMKERFSKLLLGEDMSGCGKGVCTALAISNAITNLCATIFGQLWRLEPVPSQKKSMWQREMELLLCVSDHIVELIPAWQTFPDGSKLEVMTCRPRTDLFINLPALRKLDNMLIEILDSSHDPEFWYVDQGILASESGGSASFRRPFQRQDEKWWLPVPCVPPAGLHEDTKKQLQHKRESTNQILKAAMAINSNTLAEMEVPQPYLDSLLKNARESLGDVVHRYITSDEFFPDCLLDCLEFSSDHQALEIANRVEAAIYIWRRKPPARPKTNAEKRELFADRAESLLLCLKRRFPGLTQTMLDMSKIQFNKDIGKSILESYSRVLECLAFNIVARIDDLLYVDDLTKCSGKLLQTPSVSAVIHKQVTIPCSVPISSTPYSTACSIPNLSTVPLVSPARWERIPFINRGISVKKALASYLGGETKGRNNGNEVGISQPIRSTRES